MSDDALSVLIPVLEDIVGYDRSADPRAVRATRRADPGVGSRAHRLAHDPRGSRLDPHARVAVERDRAPAGMVNQLGYAAGVITVASFLPQVVRAWRTRQTRDLSLGSLALLITAGSLWIVYGALSRDWPVVATNAGMVALLVLLAGAKARFG